MYRGIPPHLLRLYYESLLGLMMCTHTVLYNFRNVGADPGGSIELDRPLTSLDKQLKILLKVYWSHHKIL